MKTYYYIYKITCLCGSFKGKYYIGQRQSNKPFEKDTKYCGSGAKIQRYYKKYGKIEGVTYIKELICYCNTWDELQVAEDFYIGDKYKDEYPECLNLKEGGDRGKPSQETIKKQSDSHLGQPAWNAGMVGVYKIGPRDHGWTQEQRDAQSERFNKKYEADPDYRNRVGCKKGSVSPMKGKKQKQESIELQRKQLIGRKWMHNNEYEMLVQKELIDKYLSAGFVFGRYYFTTDETRNKLRNNKLGTKQSPESNKKRSNSLKGKGHPCNDNTRYHLKSVQSGSIYMTDGTCKPKQVIPSKQQDLFTNGWYRCHLNGNPW